MSLFKRCLSLVNTQSGTRDGLTVYASAFAKYLDASGITHTDIRLPGVDLQAIMVSQLKAHDALVIVGGDGTISSVVNVLASHHQQHQQEGSSVVASSGQPTPSIPLKPIVLVPCGLQNSIAHSLGLSSAQRTVSSIVVGRTIDIPVWVVLLNGKVVRWVCSYAAIGTYASIVARYQRLHHWSEEFIALPAPRMKLRAASLYTAMEHRHVPCDATLVCEPKSETSNSTVVMHKSPLRMLLMSQMPLQHKGFSLTPRASIRTNSLSTTVLTSEATRLREWHLLRREAMEGLLLEEDGLHALDGVSEVRVKLHTTDDDDPVLMMLDGEPLHLPSGAEVVVRRSGLSLPFLAC